MSRSRRAKKARAPAPALWLGSIVIDCTDFPRMVAFWQGALRYVPRDPPESDRVILKDPAGFGPNIALHRTKEQPLDDYRLHLDLYSFDPHAEVKRLVELGAQVRRPARPGEDFITLADPDGNLFDVIDKKGWAFGRRV